MTVTEIPADDSGDEEEQAGKADREDALILPAWSPGPCAAVLSRPEHDDSDDQRCEHEELDIHYVKYRGGLRPLTQDIRHGRWFATSER